MYSSNKDNLFQYPIKDENGNFVRDENGKLTHEDVSGVAVEHLKAADIDALFILGGDGTLTSARDFSRKGVNVIVSKRIKNLLERLWSVSLNPFKIKDCRRRLCFESTSAHQNRIFIHKSAVFCCIKA